MIHLSLVLLLQEGDRGRIEELLKTAAEHIALVAEALGVLVIVLRTLLNYFLHREISREEDELQADEQHSTSR